MLRVLIGIILYSLLCGITSCNNSNNSLKIFSNDLFSMEDFASANPAAIDQFFESLYQKDTSNRSLNSYSERIKEAYKKNDNKAIWHSSEGLKISKDHFLSSIDSLHHFEGIETEDIQPFIERINTLNGSNKIEDIVMYDICLSHIYTQLADKLLLGNKPPKPSKTWLFSNDSIQNLPSPLEQIAQMEIDSIQLWTSVRSQIPDYSQLMNEIKYWKSLKSEKNIDSLKSSLVSQNQDSLIQVIMMHELNITPTYDSLQKPNVDYATLITSYQNKYTLKNTGKIDENTLKILKRNSDYYIKKIHLNLERLRWIPREFSDEYIYVNIPLMELVYKRSQETIFHSNVIVGKAARPTPSMNSVLTDIVFNPPWGVPPTILKNDVVPGVSRSGGSYLARKGLKAYDSKGRDVTSQVNGSNIRNYRIAQPPGANNALGEIKFNFPNTEAIFIHDTNNRSQFNNSNRALSSGCIRTGKPKDLAELILKEKGYNLEKINEVITKRKTEKVDIEKKIGIYILYLTTHFDNEKNTIIYLKDIYNLDKI